MRVFGIAYDLPEGGAKNKVKDTILQRFRIQQLFVITSVIHVVYITQSSSRAIQIVAKGLQRE